jgi:gamma-glutamylputrescine oxidase
MLAGAPMRRRIERRRGTRAQAVRQDARGSFADAMGYNGRGVALAALLGRHLAHLTTGRRPELGPVSDGRFEPIPFHALRVPAKQVAISWKQLTDRFGL